MASSGSPSTIGRALFLALALALVGCAPKIIAVRLDKNEASSAAARPLDGVHVAIRRVNDVRGAKDASYIGRHRDGVLRIEQHDLKAAEPVVKTVRTAFTSSLVDAGAVIVDGGEKADVALDVDVVIFDVTTDGVLAGEETFGQVVLVVRFEQGREVSRYNIDEPFAVDSVQDAGMIGGALVRATRRAVASFTPRGV
jgi:hypothetical protein